jgi:hypothetical protein
VRLKRRVLGRTREAQCDTTDLHDFVSHGEQKGGLWPDVEEWWAPQVAAYEEHLRSLHFPKGEAAAVVASVPEVMRMRRASEADLDLLRAREVR